MARIIALVPDLLFGSRVQAALAGAGHDVSLSSVTADVRARTPDADVLVVDLAQPDAVGPQVLGELRAAGVPAGLRTLACYAHVDQPTRAAAEKAGFDLVVPRSRMAREAPALIERLLGGARHEDRG